MTEEQVKNFIIANSRLEDFNAISAKIRNTLSAICICTPRSVVDKTINSILDKMTCEICFELDNAESLIKDQIEKI